MCFLGDGAVNQGAFHESLNLAALFDLPVVYIIENNGYSMGTSQKRSSAYPGCLAERAEGYDMAWAQIGGADIYELRAGVHAALERARKESKPTLLEVLTYRYKGHSVADANLFKYRTKEEVERFEREHDPITLWKDTLTAEKILTEAQATEIDNAAVAEAEAAAQFAEESPFPEPSEVFDDVYWEVDNKTDAGQTGRHFFNS
jgi:pyruvate dehydrogenase E1 component alpha subunit